MAIFEHEHLREGFDKFKFIYDENGEWFHSCKHRIASIDALPHNHPFYFKSWILQGSYIEREYFINPDGKWTTQLFRREAGDAPHIVRPDTIHEIIDLPNGPVWTEIVPFGEHQPEYTWKFDSNGIFRRLKGETDFKQ